MPDRTDTDALPPRRILVATDFSPSSMAARDYALALAAPGAEVTFLHATLLPILEAGPPPAWMPDDEPTARDEIMDRLRAFSEPARRRGLSVHLVLEEGIPSEAILTVARARRVDLVALGTHGRRGLDRWVEGSTAQRVLRNCPAPVVTTSCLRSPRAARVQRILCAVGTTDSATTLSFASRLAERGRATLTCVHVVEPSVGSSLGVIGDRDAQRASAELRARTRFSAMLRAAGAEGAELLITSGDVIAEILRAAAIAGADLIVMGARDGHPAEAGFFGSTVEHVVRDAFCPVLTLRDPVAEPLSAKKERKQLATAR